MIELTSEWIEKDSKLVGNVLENKDGLNYTIVSYYKHKSKDSKKFKIRFDSGFETLTNYSHMKTGSIIDRFSPTVCNIGCLGYASFKDNQKAYYRWKAMLNRCYNPDNARYYTYGANGVTVCDRWLRFDNYLNDLPKIEGYDKELFESGDIVLDKDVKFEGNKLYSPDNCKFISLVENTLYSTIRTEGIKLKVLNIKTNTYEHFNSISSFSSKYKLNRHKVSKYINTDMEYKNFMIYLED